MNRDPAGHETASEGPEHRGAADEDVRDERAPDGQAADGQAADGQAATGHQGADEAPEGASSAHRARRRHRRVVAPPTNLAADGSDDLVRHRDQPGSADGEDRRDAWIRAQRPPHWD